MSEINNIQSTVLTPIGNLTGAIGAGSFIVNDYLITINEVENGYLLSITKGSQTQTALIKDAVSIDSIFQVASSEEDGGTNTIRIVLTDGTFADFNYYNGHKGDQGEPGLTYVERQAILQAEEERKSAELVRGSNEATRQSNEGDRILYETLRRNEEGERVQQEKNRASAENNRESAEEARVQAENNRVYNENQRGNNESSRQSQWNELKTNINNAIANIVNLEEEVETLSDKVNGAAGDVLEACIDVNNHITQSQELIGQVEEASEDILNLSAVATTLSPGSAATVTYSNGVLTFGLPKGDTGEAFHIVKVYSSTTEMNLDYDNPDIKIGDFVMVVSTVEDPDNAKVYVKGSIQFNFVVDMSGATGIKGDKGDQGNPGFSPYVEIEDITGGHRVSITDSMTTRIFDVMDGTSITDLEFQVDDNGILKYQVEVG